jgi:hypothetical protein
MCGNIMLVSGLFLLDSLCLFFFWSGVVEYGSHTGDIGGRFRYAALAAF